MIQFQLRHVTVQPANDIGVFRDGGRLPLRRQVVAGRCIKQDLPAGSMLATKATLVYQPVMMPAQQHEVIERGLTPVRPVFDVVPIDKARVRAARKAAAIVTCRQRAAYRRRNSARLATD